MSRKSLEYKTTQDELLNKLLERAKDERSIQELKSMGDFEYDWNERTLQVIQIITPKIYDISLTFVKKCEERLNSPLILDELLNNEISKKASSLPDFTSWISKCRNVSEVSKERLLNIESQQVSAEIQRVVSDELNESITSNGNSIYPDFYLRSFDYSFLPMQSRTNPIKGACQKGVSNPKPSNVPDGLELKTNRGKRVKVDAHGAHPGLHLGVTWEKEDGGISINGVYLSYIRIFDHTISGRNVEVTTVKCSFGHDNFFTILEPKPIDE